MNGVGKFGFEFCHVISILPHDFARHCARDLASRDKVDGEGARAYHIQIRRDDPIRSDGSTKSSATHLGQRLMDVSVSCL